MTVRGVHLAQRGGDDLDLRVARDDAVDHGEKGARNPAPIWTRPLVRGSRDPSADPPRCRRAHRRARRCAPITSTRPLLPAAGRVPELLAVVQVERHDRAVRLRRLHRFDNQFCGRLGERGEDAAAVEPAHAGRRKSPSSRSHPASAAPPPRCCGCRRRPARGRRGRDRCRRSPCSGRARRRA